MRDRNEALLVVDMQAGFDDSRWGWRNNPEAEINGLRAIDAWRSAGQPVVIIRHDSLNPASPLFPGTPGNALKRGFEPQAGDWLVAKSVNSAFIGTDLEMRLRRAGITAVTVFGITTDQCVSTTVRMASNLGFRTTVIEDACACFGQVSPAGQSVSAEMIHLAHITTLNTEFARVVKADDLIIA